MKKKVTDFVKSLGGTTAYSGKKKIMYITDKGFNDELEALVIYKFGKHIPFKIQTN